MDVDVWIDTLVATLRDMANAWMAYQAAIVVVLATLALILARLEPFRREGLLRSYLRINGSWQDHYLYGLLEDDFVG